MLFGEHFRIVVGCLAQSRHHHLLSLL
jgi:hypothetical protein